MTASFWGGIIAFLLVFYIAVSYTHLDVYKRQAKDDTEIKKYFETAGIDYNPKR